MTAGTHNQIVELSDRILRGELAIGDLDRKTPNLFNVQDLVSQWGQGTIRSRETEHLGRSDTGVILLRSLWQRELRALAEGRPLKQWTMPDHFDLPMSDGEQ
jgi:5,5'-dehydrodivanillate O-demethylase